MICTSVSEHISKTIERFKKGHPFTIESLYKLGSRTAVQKSLSRLVKEGKIERVARGIYARPKPLALAPKLLAKVPPQKVAAVWAKSNGKVLVNQAQEAAYRLGFQTQAPIKPIYWSNGPSREFRSGNSVVFVRHVAESKLKWPNKPEGEVLRAMLITPADNVSFHQLKNAFIRLNLNEEQSKHVLSKVSQTGLISQEWIEKIHTYVGEAHK